MVTSVDEIWRRRESICDIHDTGHLCQLVCLSHWSYAIAPPQTRRGHADLGNHNLRRQAEAYDMMSGSACLVDCGVLGQYLVFSGDANQSQKAIKILL